MLKLWAADGKTVLVYNEPDAPVDESYRRNTIGFGRTARDEPLDRNRDERPSHCCCCADGEEEDAEVLELPVSEEEEEEDQ